MEFQNGGTAKVLSLPSELKIKTKGENMVKVKNIHNGTLGFKDDDGKSHTIKPGEEVECKYKRSMDSRLIIQSETKKKKDRVVR